MLLKRTAPARKTTFKKAKTSGKTSVVKFKPFVRSTLAESYFPLNHVNLGLGFPKQLTLKHKYRDIFSATSTAGSLATQLYVCNGLFAPDASGGGHQPLYFDQLTALYNHYCVLSSKITWRFTAADNTNTKASYVGVFINDDTVGPAAVGLIAEQTTGQLRQIPVYPDKSVVISQTWDAVKYFGPSPLANTDLQGTSAANPTEKSYFSLGYQSTGGGTTSITVEVELEFVATWKELKDVAAS